MATQTLVHLIALNVNFRRSSTADALSVKYHVGIMMNDEFVEA